MDDSIEWKEAKGGQSGYPDSDDNDDSSSDTKQDCDELVDKEAEKFELLPELSQTSRYEIRSDFQNNKKFSFQSVNLSLRRNITALSDANQHKPKPNYASDESVLSFDSWLTNSLVAISPNADLLLFAGHSPNNAVFIAKLRMEPLNQYVTKSLEIPLDPSEQVTSLLCLPIMSTQKTAIGMVDWTALVVGLSSGYVRFYTEHSICLLSLKYCDEPIISLKCQTRKSNTNARSEAHFATIVDEVLITHRTIAIVVDGIGLYENLRISKDEVVKNGLHYEPAYTLANLPSILNCQKWKFESSKDSSVFDAELLGMRRNTTFDLLRLESIDYDRVLPKACARTIAHVGRNPFVTCIREPKDLASHSYTEIIGSLFSLWNKPQPSRVQLAEVSSPSNMCLFDKERLATSIISSPDKRLAVLTDDFGRIMLLDVTNWLIIRMWKGYRSAQCGWIEVIRDPDERDSPRASFLVIYAPKRGLLEIWSTQRGPRVAAFNVGKSCRLLYTGYRMMNMRADNQQRNAGSLNLGEQSYSSHCYLLNAKSESVFSIELPYTYSLYKYGDLKSRDHLLIGELVAAIQKDSDVGAIFEIVHRLALAESLENSIQKIAYGLGTDKIVPIMENLINKTMLNYDNHSGESMTDGDTSIIELSKRLIRLCSIFNDLSESTPNDLSLPEVNQRLIEQYEEHPQEIDEFSVELGWPANEILRYLSLLALDRSYRKDHLSNPWPNLGEPLAWVEFISCFSLTRVNTKRGGKKSKAKKPSSKNISTDASIRLKEFNHRFLSEDKVIKTALFMYNRLSEAYHKSLSTKQQSSTSSKLANSYNFLEPSSRLALLFQFWLTTKLCNHWKMWAFLQKQVGQISDELKVVAMDRDDDKILIETWQQIYHLILDSENVYAAIVATATIKSDTMRTIQDNDRREKLDRPKEDDERGRSSSVDWECLCIDAERMSILSQQLEDVFLLNMLLKYSVSNGNLIESHLYRVPRLSVANILLGGPTIVSELVAQWAAQSGVDLKVFTEPYGRTESQRALDLDESQQSQTRSSFHYPLLFSSRLEDLNNEEHAKELLHHTKTAFPRSLEPDVILIQCVWEFCRRWTSNTTITKGNHLSKAYECLILMSSIRLKYKVACLAYKTFFQRTLERLVILIESNSNILSAKSARLRDSLSRKELNLNEESVGEFVQFCCDLSDFLLQACAINSEKTKTIVNEDEDSESEDRLLELDNWWTAPTAFKMLNRNSDKASRGNPLELGTVAETDLAFDNGAAVANALIKTVLFSTNVLNIDLLVELNKLASLVALIFKLRIVKAYPILLIGEESRRILKLDLHQHQQKVVGAPTIAPDIQNKSHSLDELRQEFARKCIINIVAKMTEATNEFSDEEMEEDCFHERGNNGDDDIDRREDIDIEQVSTEKRPISLSKKPQTLRRLPQQDNTSATVSNTTSGSSSDRKGQTPTSSHEKALGSDKDDFESDCLTTTFQNENNESMVLFANLLSLANEWNLNCDELHLELVFELYRCNHDKIAAQLSNRILDQQTLSSGLLKISSQRVLVLFGLSPHTSKSDWRRRNDKWPMFQPNVASWLKSIQREEDQRELARLSFSQSLKTSTSDSKNTLGLHTYVLRALRSRTKLILERSTNHLEGQASRLAYDLLQLLESQLFDRLLEAESEYSPNAKGKSLGRE